MKTFAVIALLLMVAVTEQQEQQEGVEETHENELCKNLSMMLTTTSERMDSLKKTKVEVAELQGELKTATDMAAALENEVQYMGGQIQEIQETCTEFIPQDCCQMMIASNFSAKTGLYEIKDPCGGDREFIDNYSKMNARCDMETDGGGWIVIQRRITNGTANFYRNWEDYENGFGDLNGEFWIGLRNMHELTNQQEVELQVSVWNDTDTIKWNYPIFKVADVANKYRLYVSAGTGDGDTNPLAYSNGRYFSTFDRDNDGYKYRHCGSYNQAGWWYYGYRYTYINGRRYTIYCSDVNLNGRHKSSNLPDNHVARIHWGTPGNTFSNTEMKIRSTTCGLGG